MTSWIESFKELNINFFSNPFSDFLSVRWFIERFLLIIVIAFLSNKIFNHLIKNSLDRKKVIKLRSLKGYVNQILQIAFGIVSVLLVFTYFGPKLINFIKNNIEIPNIDFSKIDILGFFTSLSIEHLIILIMIILFFIISIAIVSINKIKKQKMNDLDMAIISGLVTFFLSIIGILIVSIIKAFKGDFSWLGACSLITLMFLWVSDQASYMR